MEAKDIGNRIRALREERKMTQYALANQAGVSPTYVYQLERGEKSPTIEYLEYICWGLGITLTDFFKESEDINDKISALSTEQKKLLNNFLSSL